MSLIISSENSIIKTIARLMRIDKSRCIYLAEKELNSKIQLVILAVNYKKSEKDSEMNNFGDVAYNAPINELFDLLRDVIYIYLDDRDVNIVCSRLQTIIILSINLLHCNRSAFELVDFDSLKLTIDSIESRRARVRVRKRLLNNAIIAYQQGKIEEKKNIIEQLDKLIHAFALDYQAH